jgi:DNA-directed RNA polymerase specialized sigma24 family protein
MRRRNQARHEGQSTRSDVMTDALFRDDRVRWAYETFQAVATLDPVTATALLLVYDRHLAQPQVAAQLGLPESEVKTRIADGMRRLGLLVVATSASPEQASMVVPFALITPASGDGLPAGDIKVAG